MGSLFPNISMFFRETTLITKNENTFFLCHVFQYFTINQQNTMKDLYYNEAHPIFSVVNAFA